MDKDYKNMFLEELLKDCNFGKQKTGYLLEYYKTIDEILESNYEELFKVPSISKKTIPKIKEAFEERELFFKDFNRKAKRAHIPNMFREIKKWANINKITNIEAAKHIFTAALGEEVKVSFSVCHYSTIIVHFPSHYVEESYKSGKSDVDMIESCIACGLEKLMAA